MELRKANDEDFRKISHAVNMKKISFCTPSHIAMDFIYSRLYAVVENGKVLATVSLVEELEYGYMAVKRLCILNKKNQGKGIARFALHEIQKEVKGRIGATPWDNNDTMKHLLETEGFKMEYKFMEHWCFYVKEV